MAQTLSFRGTAHPPPRRDGRRDNIADLSSAEIGCTQLGKNGGTDLLVEHEHGAKVGVVDCSWEGTDGRMRVSGRISDPNAINLVRTGKMRGLSLGTSVMKSMDDKRLYPQHDELSICEQPRRAGCYIDELNGKSVVRHQRFSKKGALKPCTPPSRANTHNSTLHTNSEEAPWLRLRLSLLRQWKVTRTPRTT